MFYCVYTVRHFLNAFSTVTESGKILEAHSLNSSVSLCLHSENRIGVCSGCLLDASVKV